MEYTGRSRGTYILHSDNVADVAPTLYIYLASFAIVDSDCNYYKWSVECIENMNIFQNYNIFPIFLY